jgi:hypothetical protein
VSRPMERCQETSQAPPMEDEVTAMAPIQIYQGTVALLELTRVALEIGRGAKAEAGRAAEDMLPPKVYAEMIRPKN